MTQLEIKRLPVRTGEISSENPSDFIHFETLRFFENALLGGLPFITALKNEKYCIKYLALQKPSHTYYVPQY